MVVMAVLEYSVKYRDQEKRFWFSYEGATTLIGLKVGYIVFEESHEEFACSLCHQQPKQSGLCRTAAAFYYSNVLY